MLTPPTGIPVVPDLGAVLPTQRQGPPPEPVRPAAPPVQRTVDLCVCGHREAAHEHYRPGTDCGACGRTACRQFRPEGSRWRRLRRRLRLGG